MDDPALLQRYITTRDESAFTELVQRHLGLVYHTALRRLSGDAHHAHDVSQTVFTLLARKAPSLTRHPSLTGWLYTAATNNARELIRTEQRRLARENETHAMGDQLSSTPNDESWQQLRPVIDDALSELKTTDRDALLLRYFEDRPLAHVATALHLSEDAARMKVNRALEKLREALSKRGVTSTASAITATLMPHISLAAPTGMAAQISSSALSLATTATTAVGTGITALTFLKIMATSKILTGTVAVVALCVAGIKVHEFAGLRIDFTDLKSKHTALLLHTKSLENDLADERRKVREKHEDNARMLAAIDLAKAEVRATTPKVDPAAITKESVYSRYQRASELAQSGKSAEALEELLWCYDDGMTRFPDFKGVRLSFLLHEISKMGKTYPPALDALHERREQAAQRMATSSNAREAAADFASLNRVLGEEGRNLELYDQLPANSPVRKGLIVHVYDQLIDAGRYTDAASAQPYSKMLSEFTRDKTEVSQEPAISLQPFRQYITSTTAKNIEVLVGAGSLQDARSLADQLLAFDNSAETKALLVKHLTRAGHADLLKP